MVVISQHIRHPHPHTHPSRHFGTGRRNPQLAKYYEELRVTLNKKKEIEERIKTVKEKIQQRKQELQSTKESEQKKNIKQSLQNLERDKQTDEDQLLKKDVQIQEIQRKIRKAKQFSFYEIFSNPLQNLSSIAIAIGSLVVAGIGVYNIRENKKKKDKCIREFLHQHQANSQELLAQSGMVFKQENRELKKGELIFLQTMQDLKTINKLVKFLKNETWAFNSNFQRAVKAREQKVGKKRNVLQFYGDPGIGKSTAFAILFHYLSNKSTHKFFRDAFPFLSRFANFLMIDGSAFISKNPDAQARQTYISYLKEHDYLIVVDNAHLMIKEKSGEQFIRSLIDKFEWVILLSSQPIHDKKELLKNCTQKFILTELVHDEAVEIIQKCFEIQNNSLAQITPPKQAEYFAYRMWFYTGGNIRMLKKEIFQDEYFEHYEYFLQAHDLAVNENFIEVNKAKKNTTQQSASNTEQPEFVEKQKQSEFQGVFKLLTGHYTQTIENIVTLNFQIKIIKSLDSIKKKIHDLQDKNILVKKKIKLQDQNGQIIKNGKFLSFHSRRTHYAFSMWMLRHYQQYWNEPHQRVLFQQHLERIEYQYLLEFQVFKLKKHYKTLKRLQTFDQHNTNQQEEKKEGTIQKITPEEVQALIQRTEAEIELTMLLYAAYQMQRKDQYSTEREFTPKPIINDMKKGPDYFYTKFKPIIDGVLEQDETLKEKIQELNVKVEGMKKNSGTAELFYKKEAEDYLNELKNSQGFQLQNSLTLPDFEKMEPISEEKYEEAVKQLEDFPPSYKKQVIKVALELAVNAHFRWVKQTKEKAIEKKIEEQTEK